jgi:hypothetical protein
VGCFLFVAFSSIAVAAEKKEISQVINLYEGVLSYPVAYWMEENGDLSDFKVFRQQEQNSFTLEQIPKSQEFEHWTTIYGVYAWYLPEYDFKRFVAESFRAMALGCKEKPTSMLITSEDGRMVTTFHCQSLADPFVVNGNNVESGFLYLSYTGKTFVKVYQAWRGKAEDMGTTKWPLNEKSITKDVKNFLSMRLLSAELPKP